MKNTIDVNIEFPVGTPKRVRDTAIFLDIKRQVHGKNSSIKKGKEKEYLSRIKTDFLEKGYIIDETLTPKDISAILSDIGKSNAAAMQNKKAVTLSFNSIRDAFNYAVEHLCKQHLHFTIHIRGQREIERHIGCAVCVVDQHSEFNDGTIGLALDLPLKQLSEDSIKCLNDDVRQWYNIVGDSLAKFKAMKESKLFSDISDIRNAMSHDPDEPPCEHSYAIAFGTDVDKAVETTSLVLDNLYGYNVKTDVFECNVSFLEG